MIRQQLDPVSGATFYYDEEGDASWNDPEKLIRKNRRLSFKGKELFRKSAVKTADGIHGGISMAFDMRKNDLTTTISHMQEFIPASSGGLSVAGEQLKCGMKDPMRFTAPSRSRAHEGKTFFKPRQVFCYSCGREFGTNSLKIHWKSCVRKRLSEMQRRPKHLRRPLANPPDERRFPFPDFRRSSDKVFEVYNQESLRIYGNSFGVYICFKCKVQFTNESDYLRHLKNHDREDSKREADERARRQREMEEEEARRLQRVQEAARRRAKEEEAERARYGGGAAAVAGRHATTARSIAAPLPLPSMNPATMIPRPDPSTKSYRDLYIGNMPGGPLEVPLKSFLSRVMIQAGFATGPGDPLVQVRCTAKYAFAEFRSIPEATNALNLNGVFFQGRVLKIGRPRSYHGPLTQATTWAEFVAAKVQEDPSLEGKFEGVPPAQIRASATRPLTDPNTKKYRELYIGNMPDGILPDQLTQFVGQAMHQTGLVPSPDVVHLARINSRFAFAEFKTVEATNLALNLDGIPLLASTLRFGRPKQYDGIPTEHGNWNETCSLGLAGLLQKYPNMNPSLEQMVPAAPPSMAPYAHMGSAAALPLPIPSMMTAAVAAAAVPVATKVVQMSNMVTAAELRDEAEYNDIVEDIREEMAKSGKVESVLIPRPPANPEAPISDESVGLIFVAFATVQGARNAKQTVQGRTFNGNTVGVDFYPVDMFEQGKLIDVRKQRTVAPPTSMPPRGPPPPPPAATGYGGGSAMGGYGAPPSRPPPPPGPMGGFRRGPPVPHGAGRGKSATLPAWMTQGK
eukprot:g117.t1